MLLSIVIVNYKSKTKTTRCLESILNADLSGINYEIIIVDNASGDNLEDLKEKFSDLILIQSDKNLGMGGGNNLGMKIAKGEFILILNPDTIVDRMAIKTLVSYLKNNPDAYIVGPKLLYPDGSLQYSCALFPKFYTPILRRTFLGNFFKKSRDRFMMINDGHQETKEVDWLMGSCLLIRKEGWEGFDERFFMYFEDIDVCRRVKAVSKKVIYHPEASVIHDHTRQSAEKPWYLAPFCEPLAREHIKSWIKYFRKWGLK